MIRYFNWNSLHPKAQSSARLPATPYGSSPDLRRGIGSLARRRGCESFVRRSRLPAGRPRPWTASSRIRVISCESVRCSAAARRRRDSLRWLGTYAPMKTPFRLAIYHRPLSRFVGKNNPAIAEQVYKPNSVPRLRSQIGDLKSQSEVAIIHLAQPLPAGSSDLPGGRSL